MTAVAAIGSFNIEGHHMPGINPRAARVAALIQRVIASATEGKLHDKRLDGITITEVRVTNDLQIARVYWTILGHEGKELGERDRAKQALKQASGRLRTLVGRQLGLRLTPQLQFLFDEVPQEAHEIEDILTTAHQRDEELRQLRQSAQYAGEADPYRHEDDDEDSTASHSGTDGTYDTDGTADGVDQGE